MLVFHAIHVTAIQLDSHVKRNSFHAFGLHYHNIINSTMTHIITPCQIIIINILNLQVIKSCKHHNAYKQIYEMA